MLGYDRVLESSISKRVGTLMSRSCR